MLQITIPECELWDSDKQEFVNIKEQTLQLEHSLVSVSKWEARWNKVFLSKEEKTVEQTIDYIKCMTITQNVKDEVYNGLTADIITKINDYISAPMTATWFSNENQSHKSNEKITSELIYYWMISLNIPFECQKWHLNRLLTLIKVCNIKNTPPKKMSKHDLASRNAALNAARRKQYNTTG